MFKYAVIEHQKLKGSGLVGLNGHELNQKTQAVWNILYSVPYDTADDEETLLAFNACMAWIEQNKTHGSKYIVTEMFFVE